MLRCAACGRLGGRPAAILVRADGAAVGAGTATAEAAAAPGQPRRSSASIWTMELVLMAVLAGLAAGAAEAPPIQVAGHYLAPKKPGGEAVLLVSLVPDRDELRVNEVPAPRLELDPKQAVLRYRAPEPDDGETPRGYLDPLLPVRFPVTLAPGAARGEHVVKGSVSFYYCSTRASWCKRGSREIEVAVTVP